MVILQLNDMKYLQTNEITENLVQCEDTNIEADEVCDAPFDF